MKKPTVLITGVIVTAFLTAAPPANAEPMYVCNDNGFGNVHCYDQWGGGSYDQTTSCDATGIVGCSTTWIQTPGYSPGSGYSY